MIQPCGEKICGKIVWLSESRNADGSEKLDIHNKDESLRERSIMGLELLTDFTAAGDVKWTEGEIYNPEDGKTYRSELELTDSGTLKVTGCVFFLQDTDLDPGRIDFRANTAVSPFGRGHRLDAVVVPGRVSSTKMFPLYVERASLRRVRVMHASGRMAEPSACFMPAVFILYAAVDDKHLFAARMRIPPQFASRRYSGQAGEPLVGLRIVVER